MHKPRVQVQRNTRTEIHADSRTKRRRTRSDIERSELDAEAQEWVEAHDDGTCRAGMWCIYHGKYA